MKGGHRVMAKCVCCRGWAAVLVYGPSVWNITLICHRCNVSECGKREYDIVEGPIRDWFSANGCKSRDGKPILRYQGRR